MSMVSVAQTPVVVLDEPRKRRSSLRLLLRSHVGFTGLLVVSAFIVLAIVGPEITPYGPLQQITADALQSVSAHHWLGTDQLGRDVLSRVLAGARTSIEVGLISVIIGVVVGVPIGLVAGYAGGASDEVLMRLMDALYAFPSILLALAIVAAIGPGAQNVMIAIGITTCPVFSRLVRGQVLIVREADYVQAVRAMGAAPARIMLRHILPNSAAPVIVQASLSAGFAVLAEASLSYLGVGIRPPAPTWGGMLSEGFPLVSFNPWLSVVPGLLISLLILGLNFLGDGLRDVLDPRLRSSLAMKKG